MHSPGSHLGDLAKLTSDPVIPLLTFSHPKSPTGSSSEGQYGIQALQDWPVPAHLLFLQTPQYLFIECLPSPLPELISIPLPFKAEFCGPLFQRDLLDHLHTYKHDTMYWVLLDIPKTFCVFHYTHCIVLSLYAHAFPWGSITPTGPSLLIIMSPWCLGYFNMNKF